MPDEEHDERTNDSADQAGALIGPVPADRLPDQCRDERAGNAEEGGENKSRWVVWSRRQKARDDSGDKADDDHPEYSHSDPHNELRTIIFAR